MIVEEKKAVEKACCDHPHLHCQGSRCMAWRWDWVDVEKSTDDEFAPAREWIERVPSITHGYCGLGGRP